ncbi:uncharacterized protein LOC116167101 [Photinus pyralis]|nr:uncharacterized protein LOC116163885 [Photinus pyralis]XP_031338201.1 uncharacterized protein LOC116167101 [Photinus pyralis]
MVQSKHFGFDIKQLVLGKECSEKLRKLRPLVQDGLLRVGGRLGRAQITFDQKHPLILPAKEPLVDRLVDYYHQTNLHTGPHLLEAIIRQKYWIIAGRNLIRSRVHACNHCFRRKPLAKPPIMADLPSCRVQPAKAFLHTGVDYFGPINITLGRRRGTSMYKAYVCLFVCMSIKAVHMELRSLWGSLFGSGNQFYRSQAGTFGSIHVFKFSGVYRYADGGIIHPGR